MVTRQVSTSTIRRNREEYLASDQYSYWKMVLSWWYRRLPWIVRRRLIKHDGWSLTGNRCAGATTDAKYACAGCSLARLRFMDFEQQITLESFQCERCRTGNGTDSDLDEFEECDECESIFEELNASKRAEVESLYPCFKLDRPISPREVLSDTWTDNLETELYGHMLRSNYGPEITSTILRDMIEHGSSETKDKYVSFMLGVSRASEQERKRTRANEKIVFWTLIVAVATLLYIVLSSHWESLNDIFGHLESLVRTAL